VLVNKFLESYGTVVDGQWHDVWYDTKSTGSTFKHETFHQLDHGGQVQDHPVRSGLQLKSGQYHLYVSTPVRGRTVH
jgi:putative glutathione S-transferase